jgi:hypothetical protein
MLVPWGAFVKQWPLQQDEREVKVPTLSQNARQDGAPCGLLSAQDLFLADSFRYARTSSAWMLGFTFSKMCWILPSGPMMNVVRAMPITFLPYMFFSCRTPKAMATFLSASASKVNGKASLSANFLCAEGLSGDMPSSTAPVF